MASVRAEVELVDREALPAPTTPAVEGELLAAVGEVVQAVRPAAKVPSATGVSPEAETASVGAPLVARGEAVTEDTTWDKGEIPGTTWKGAISMRRLWGRL
jgi:hypothetical protein